MRFVSKDRFEPLSDVNRGGLSAVTAAFVASAMLVVAAAPTMVHADDYDDEDDLLAVPLVGIVDSEDDDEAEEDQVEDYEDDDDLLSVPLIGIVDGEPIPDDQFDLQVRGLEEQVSDLKEKVFQTKARLLLLQETVIGGDLSTGARAVIVHRNEMGSSFVLESVTFILDGAPVFTRVDQTGELDRQKEFEVFSGRIVPGTHQLGVRMVYRGRGYGVFSYLNDYRFRLQSSYTFNAEAGKVTRISVVGYERGGFTAELQDRPGVRYEEEVTTELPGATTQTAQLEAER